MDYAKVLSRAWQITWRWKVLWILGFLASLGSGGGGGGGNFYSTSGDEINLGPWSGWQPDAAFWTALAGIIAAVVCFFLIVAIALWVISIIARGGLIAGVQQVEDEGETSFRQAWVAGRDRFWTLLGVAFLAALPMIVVLLALVVAGLWAFLAFGAAAAGAKDPFEALGAMAPPGIFSAVCFVGLLCCGLVIVGIVLDQIRIYAERAAMLEGLTWIDAFKRGWQVLKENLGPTIIFWLIFVAIGFMVVMAVLAIVAAAALPAVLVLTNIEPGWWMVAPVCLGGLLAFIIFALIGSIVETFTSTTWTLVYRELTGIAGETPAEPEEILPESEVA